MNPLIIPQWLGVPIILAGIVTIWWAFGHPLLKFPLGFISLEKAARKAYASTQGTSVATFAEKNMSGEEGILKWYASVLRASGMIPVFGARPSSTKLTEILHEEWASCSYENNDLVRENKLVYTNLSIRASDFRRRLKEIKTWDLSHGPW